MTEELTANGSLMKMLLIHFFPAFSNNVQHVTLIYDENIRFILSLFHRFHGEYPFSKNQSPLGDTGRLEKNCTFDILPFLTA